MGLSDATIGHARLAFDGNARGHEVDDVAVEGAFAHTEFGGQAGGRADVVPPQQLHELEESVRAAQGRSSGEDRPRTGPSRG
jgi:hypothetical protein